MPDMQTALRGRIVSAVGHNRVYPVIAAQNAALPYVRYQTISDPRPDDLDGYQGARETRMQVDCFAASYEGARAAAEAVARAMQASGTFGGVVFGRIEVEGPRDLGDDATGGFIHQASMDLLVWHRMA